MTACEWDDCQDEATHTVVLTLTGEAEEIWQVCRAHDRQLKLNAVRSRAKRPERPVQEPVAAPVRCGECGQLLDEPAFLPLDARRPCPCCWSLARRADVGATATMRMRSGVRARTKRPGKGGWMVETRAGDDYTRDLEAWGRRELTTDRDQNLYREVIELYEGSRIVSTARLSDHRG